MRIGSHLPLTFEVPPCGMRRILLLALVLPACGGDDECTVDTTYDPVIEPANFAPDVTNPLFPLPAGASWVYMGGDERVEVTVTADRRTILGISAVAVHDVATINGDIIEDTIDFYAQDLDGNVWYLGEDTAELENGVITSTEGSWIAGVDGAKPGILIPATPAVGVPYRQEYLPCEAEDMGEVLATSESVTVGGITHDNCLHTRDTTPLEPDVQEDKFYCPGVGLVLTVDLETDQGEELISMTP
jgi:hypothetical protein